MMNMGKLLHHEVSQSLVMVDDHYPCFLDFKYFITKNSDFKKFSEVIYVSKNQDYGKQ
jgi:hypothetical protein